MKIVDVGAPANPQRLGRIAAGGEARDVAASGNYAYVAAYFGGLRVFEVSNPADPLIVAQHHTWALARGIALSGNHAYLADLPFQQGQFVFYGEGLVAFDTTNPAQLQKLGNTVFGSAYDSMEGPRSMATTSNRLYLPNGFGGLLQFDISDPTNVVRSGVYHAGGYAQGVDVSGDYVYRANSSRSPGPVDVLEVIDFSDPTSPQRVGGYGTNGSVNAVVVSGTRAYLAARWQGPEVIDVSDPSNPATAAFGAAAVSTIRISVRADCRAWRTGAH